MTSSPKLGSIGSDLIMSPVLNSLVTLHQNVIPTGTFWHSTLEIPCIPVKARKHLETLRDSLWSLTWISIKDLCAFFGHFLFLTSDFQNQPWPYVGLLSGLPSSAWSRRFPPFSASWSVMNSSASLANSSGITGDTTSCVAIFVQITFGDVKSSCWLLWWTQLALMAPVAADLPQQSEEAKCHLFLMPGDPKEPQWLTSTFRHHICRQHSCVECFAQWKHLMHSPLSFSVVLSFDSQEKLLGAIFVQTCDLFWGIQLFPPMVVMTLSTHDHGV